MNQLPPSLEALKAHARRNAGDTAAEQREARARSWSLLMEAAAAALPAGLLPFVRESRGVVFSADAVDYSLEIALPGHRLIYAPFHRGIETWHRARYHGPTTDVKNGAAAWMVEPLPGRHMTYYQGLGAALVAAELPPEPERVEPAKPASLRAAFDALPKGGGA
jgi:hypothetical protein